MAKTAYEKGENACQAVLSGEVCDFECYVLNNMPKDGQILSVYENMGKYIYCYLKEQEPEVQTEIVDKIFAVKNFNKFPIFRIARDIAINYIQYRDNSKKRKYYMALHGVQESVLKTAIEVAGMSTLSRRYVGLSYSPSEYGQKVQKY